MKLQVIVHIKTNTIELINSENGETLKFDGQHINISPPLFALGYTVTINDVPFEVRND